MEQTGENISSGQLSLNNVSSILSILLSDKYLKDLQDILDKMASDWTTAKTKLRNLRTSHDDLARDWSKTETLQESSEKRADELLNKWNDLVA